VWPDQVVMFTPLTNDTLSISQALKPLLVEAAFSAGFTQKKVGAVYIPSAHPKFEFGVTIDVTLV